MKKTVFVLAVAACALSVMSINVMAEADKEKKDDGKKESVTVTGALAVTTNETGKVTGATITDKKDKVYNIVMECFTQTITGLDCKKVRAKGEVKEVEGKTMLTVKGEIKAVPEKKEGKAKGK